MDCKHATPTERRNVVICELGNYGGMPHIGVCKQCDRQQHLVDKDKRTRSHEDEIEYQQGVLKRMKKNGCKPCEKRRQQKHIEKLKNDI